MASAVARVPGHHEHHGAVVFLAEGRAGGRIVLQLNQTCDSLATTRQGRLQWKTLGSEHLACCMRFLALSTFATHKT